MARPEYTLEEQGFKKLKLSVYIFHDDREDLRWFWRSCTKVGEIECWCEGGAPLFPDDVLKLARDTFGPEASVMWVC